MIVDLVSCGLLLGCRAYHDCCILLPAAACDNTIESRTHADVQWCLLGGVCRPGILFVVFCFFQVGQVQARQSSSKSGQYLLMSIYLRMYIWISVSMYVGLYLCVNACMHVRTCNIHERERERRRERERDRERRRYMFAWMYACMYVCVYVCMYLCMYACM